MWGGTMFCFRPSFFLSRPGRNLVVTRFYSSSFCDVLILGGGMVGGSLGCALAAHPAFRGKRVIILEQGKKSTSLLASNAPWSNRVCEVSPGSADFLRSIGVWEFIKQQRFKTVSRMQVWDSATDSYIVFDPDSTTDGVACYTVENDVTTRAIERRLDALVNGGADLDLRYEARVSRVTFPGASQRHDSRWAEVKLEGDAGVIEARLVVGSDGAHSRARAAAKIRTMDYDFEQMGIVATLNLEKALGNTVAWQRFLPTGPIALLPLDDDTSSLVWSNNVNEAKRLLEMDEQDFVAAVNDAVWGEDVKTPDAVKFIASKYSDLLWTKSGRQLPPRVSSLESGSRALFPLKLSHSVDYVKNRLALVGDAAHRVHPMAGQGVNLGYGDAAELSEILIDGASRGEDIGSASLLKNYEISRQRKVLPLIAGLQGIHFLYGTQWAPVVAARSIGLQSVDAIPVVKNLFLRYATQR